mmetsp:Transcript_25033/g.22125  ORF Transcript_25033/g.22125 Transcript_25033/m.22125 type:complete len:102 (-) Transcript_25033:315-620(-)
MANIYQGEYLMIERSLPNPEAKILMTVVPEPKTNHPIYYACLSEDNRFLLVFKRPGDKKKSKAPSKYIEYFDILDQKFISHRLYSPKKPTYVPILSRGGIA